MLTPTERQLQIEKNRALPSRLRYLTVDLSDEALTTHFIAGEWTVAQNVHHLADTHMNSFIFFKRILTEERPPVHGYNSDVWADMADANHANIELSLGLLESLHARWVQLLTSLTHEQFTRVGIYGAAEECSIDFYLRAYGNHGEAHLDQIQRTLAAGES